MTGELNVAVHALVYLYHKNMILASDVLAENVCTNPARIRKILAKMKKAGFVDTKEGINGGYFLIREAGSITLKDVCIALESAIIKTGWSSGDPEMECLVASGMSNVMENIYNKLNEQCLDTLNKITIKDVNDQLFMNKSK